MQDYPPLAGRDRRERGKPGNQQHQTRDTGASLWIAAATVIISLGVLLFTQGNLRNGGAPFVMTSPSAASGSQAVPTPDYQPLAIRP